MKRQLTCLSTYAFAALTINLTACDDEKVISETVIDDSTQAGAEEANGDGENTDTNGENTEEEENTGENMTAEEGVSTEDVLCGYAISGTQFLNYELFDPNTGVVTEVDDELYQEFAWNCDAQNRTLTGNGIPDHNVTNGRFATPISAQEVRESIPLRPVLSTADPTVVRDPGYTLNGIGLEPGTGGRCPDSATSAADCDPAGGNGTWKMVALPGNVSNWQFSFGVDDNNAHVQPGGQYHVHGLPTILINQTPGALGSQMVHVGWAIDGFPIYSQYGYQDASDANSSIVELASSYQTIASPDATRPSVDDIELGHFEQDWEYVEGSGDLDECNGRFGVTPEFPEGIYHYYITTTYPFVQRCVKGVVPASAGGAGGPGGNPPQPSN